ncbi:MAG: poly-gamma-glutamate hydrolase family protein [Anaerolineae bacterium]|nr:poly-gamma-glutamate hydrolase family protein [Anaerolineae bacterium]
MRDCRCRLDTYESFAHLASFEEEGRDYSCTVVDRGSDILLMAPHGGGIEQGTSEIAQAVAGDAWSFYAFNGLKRSANERLHITSTRFDEPRALRLARQATVVCAIHGLRGAEEAIYVGGLGERLRAKLLEALSSAGFQVDQGEGRHAGISPTNPCNRGTTGRGIQLEITRGLRRTMFQALDRQGRRSKKPSFYRFVRVVRGVLLDAR